MAAISAAGRTLNVAMGLFSVLLICVFSSLRQNTGTDFQVYRELWEGTQPISQTKIIDLLMGFYEPLFSLLNSILKNVTSNDVAFFSLYATITLAFLHAGIARLKLNQSFAHFIYFSVFCLPYLFNGMRQAVAMSLFVFAIPSILAHRTRSVFAISLISAGFHASGLLIFVAYIFSRITDSISPRRTFVAVTLLGGALGAAGIASTLFFSIFPAISPAYRDLFDAPTSLPNVITRLFLCALMLSFAPKFNSNSNSNSNIASLLNIYMLGLLIYLLFIQFNMIATRFNMLFRVLEVAIIPMILSTLTGYRRLAFITASTGFALATLYYTCNLPDYAYNYIK